MLLLKVVGMLLKYELGELAITSGSLIMMPFSLMEVLHDLRFLRRMVLMFQHHSSEYTGEFFWYYFTVSKTTLKKMIILLSGSSGYFSE